MAFSFNSACENRKCPDIFQNKSVSFYFKWVAKYILFFDKLKREGTRLFLGEINRDFSPKLLLHIGVMLTISKVLTILFSPAFSSCGNRGHPCSFKINSVSSSLKWVLKYILFLIKPKCRGMSFLRLLSRAHGCYKRRNKYLLFQNRNNSTLPLLFIRAPYK